MAGLVAAACAAMTLYVVRGVPWSLALHPGAPASWAVDPRVLLGDALRLLAAAWLFAVWGAVGRLLLKPLGLAWRDRWEETGLAFAAGSGVWGTALQLLGLAGLWTRPLLAGLALAGAWPLGLWLRELRVRPPRPRLPEEPWARAALAACCAVVLYHLPLVLLPETFYDALNYHLGMPNLYLLRGVIGPTPWNSYSGIPSIPMMLYGQALSLDSWGVAARLVHFAMLGALLVELRGLAARAGFTRTAPLALAVFALAPVVQTESFRTSTGLEWALFQAAAFHALLAARGEPAGSPSRRAWLLVCGSLAGFAAATKYPAATAVLAAVACVLPRRGLRAWDAALILAAALAWTAPWLLRNLAFYHDPLYPFFAGSVGPWRPDWRRIAQGGLRPAALASPRFWASWLLRPLRDARSASEFGGAFGPAFLGLLPAAFGAPLPEGAGLLALFLGASWVPLSLASRITRFFVPGLALWAAFAAWTVDALPARARRLAASAGLTAALGAGAAVFVMRLPAFDSLDAVLGGVGFREYLSHERLSAAYAAPPFAGLQWVEDHARPGERALLVGDARQFPWRVDHLSSSEDQRSWLEVLADQSADGEDLARRLRSLRVRWIVTNRAEAALTGFDLTVTPRGAASLRSFLAAHARRVFQVRDAGRDVFVDEVD
ncbi:MAG: hypothetical protein KGL53_11385 [Elusimicrobia bacterium]|nr:hypothetical protein [Elusimicrobiota bacterium]